jgi:hypothetical protein
VSAAWAEEWHPEPRVLAQPLIARWQRYQAFLMEHGSVDVDPETGEVVERVPAPRIRPGVWLRSVSMKRVAGGVLGRGGIVISRSDDDAGWETLEAFQGQIRRFRVMDDDIDWSVYKGEINTRDLESLRRAIARDMAGKRNRHNIQHLGALAVLTSILENPALASNADRDIDPRLAKR